MFKPVAFDPYRRRRSRWRVPSWFVFILLGMAIGIAGLIYLQERYLGPRLSMTEGMELRRSFENANEDRTKLKVELADAVKKMDAAVAEKAAIAGEMANSRSGVQGLQDDLNSVIASLPPDPRGGPVQIRAGWVVLRAGKLGYDVVLTRDAAANRSTATTIAANMVVTVSGESMSGTPKTVNLSPVPVSIGTQQILRGALALPGDFKPLQATLQIVERDGGKALGMRVLLVK